MRSNNGKIKVVVANYKNLETHSIVEKIVRLFSVPLLNNLPGFLVRGVMRYSNRSAALVLDSLGSARSMEIVYAKYGNNPFSQGLIEGITNIFWHNYISQSKGLRNRLRIAEKVLEKEIFLKLAHQEIVEILIVGGGSGRSLMGPIAYVLSQQPDKSIKVFNVDKSADSLALGKKTAEEFNLYHIFTWIHDDAMNISRLFQENSLDIVEMVGLLDYFSDEDGLKIIGYIYKILKDNGTLILSNIYPNAEKKFVRKMGWPTMYYRTPETLSNLLEKAGFSLIKGEIIFEPLKNHIVALIKK